MLHHSFRVQVLPQEPAAACSQQGMVEAAKVALQQRQLTAARLAAVKQLQEAVQEYEQRCAASGHLHVVTQAVLEDHIRPNGNGSQPHPGQHQEDDSPDDTVSHQSWSTYLAPRYLPGSQHSLPIGTE